MKPSYVIGGMLCAIVAVAVVFLLIGRIRLRNECMELARLCVEQDPATAEWVFDMAKGAIGCARRPPWTLGDCVWQAPSNNATT